MAIRRMKMAMLLLMVMASMQLKGSMALIRHTVGVSNSWEVPSDASAYSKWSSSQTFTVGDTLVFTFVTGLHNVAEVTRSAYNTCNDTSPISLTGNGPATFNLATAGTRYFICTVGSHCVLGQKVAINVSAATTSSPPAAQPAIPPSSIPPSATTPAPGPSSGAPATYIVGDELGWTVPSDGATTYKTWASGKTFVAGDILVFNFVRQAHNVAEVSRTAFDSCNTTSTIRVVSSSPARITLTGGSHYFICTYPQHCSLGQQLAINVTGSPTALPPSTPTAPSPDRVNTPPPPNSGQSVAAAAALPLALASIALVFLYC